MAKLAGSIKAWASNPVHLVGDFPGDDTKVDGGDGVINAGFIPGDIFAPTAEETNNEFGRWTSVLQWVQDGTSASVAEAGIVERSATGQINAERLIILNTQNQSGIDSTGDLGNTGVIGRSTRTGVHGLGSGAFPALLGACSSTGAGVQGTSTGGYGGRFTGGAAQAGVRSDGSAAGSPGLEANGTGGQPDILLTPADNYGLDIQCGASALGGIRVLANGQLGLSITQDDPNVGAVVLFGDGAAAAGVATLDTRAFGAGNALWAVASSGTGYAARFSGKSVAPTRAPISVDPQNSLPSNIESGQVGFVTGRGWVHSQFNDFGLPGPGVGWRGFWSSTGGFSLAVVTQKSLLVSGGAWQEAATATAEGGNAPGLAGRKVTFRLTLSHKVNLTNTPMTLNFKVRDETAGVDVLIRSGAGGGATAGIYIPGYDTVAWLPGISETFELTIPNAGARTWKVYLSVTGATSVSTRGISLEHCGMQ